MLSNDEDDVPPLEDLSLYFKKKKKEAAPPINIKKVEQSKNVESTIKKSVDKSNDFSGLKKGFFSSKPKPSAVKSSAVVPSSKPKDDTSDEIPFIKFKPETNEFLEIKEVKDKLASQFDQRKSDWMTPEFLQKIESSPVLRAAFQDPRFSEVSQKLAQDPVGTMKVVSNTMPQFIEALKEFMGLIGEAMEKRADLEDAKAAKLDDHEQKLVDRVMKDQAVQDALKDKDIQNLLLTLRNDSSQSLSKIMASANPKLRKKIQILINCGLLSVVQ